MCKRGQKINDITKIEQETVFVNIIGLICIAFLT